MHCFTDNKGYRWTISVTVGDLKRVRAAVGIDLASLTPQALLELSTKPIELVDTLYVLCEKEAKEVGVSDESFGERLCGDSLERATEAFVEAMIDFFPNARDRQATRALMKSIQEAAEMIRAENATALANPNLPTLIASVARGGRSIGSPGSSE